MIFGVHQPARRVPPRSTVRAVPRWMCRTRLQQLPDGTATISVSGDVDAYTVGHLADRIASLDLAALPALIIDLREVDFLGVAGLQVLGELLTTARGLRTRVRLVCASRPVLRSLQVGGLAWAIAGADDTATALAECASTLVG